MKGDDEREEQITDLSMQRSRAGREDRADFLEDTRAGRADDVEELRLRRAAELAYKQGRREADVDSYLQSHEKRLNAINGSITKTAVALDTLTGEVRSVKSGLKERDKVNEALVKAAAGQGARALSRTQEIGIIAMTLLAFASLAVAIVQALGHS